MTYKLFLFDMDGVLLEPRGYHEALRASIKRIGIALGAPNTIITEDQIARFETLNITNEWDSLAICAALILIYLWKSNADIRLDGLRPNPIQLTDETPDFNTFLNKLPDGGHLPGETAFHFLLRHNPWINPDQRAHLWSILGNCRDIYQSPTLPAHQETILGSHTFQDHYHLAPQLNTESYLEKFDRSIMNVQQSTALREWLSNPNQHAGILTNRPNRTPPGHLSAPEAELGIALIGLQDLPCVGSGILGWFAVNHYRMPEHTFLKPNPVHALTLMQRCLGSSQLKSLRTAAALWQGKGRFSNWQELDGAKITIFEDSAKGLHSGRSACALLKEIGVEIELKLVGVAQNPIKQKALEELSTIDITNINEVNWSAISS